MWYVYIGRFWKEFLYTGITTDVARRIKQHNTGVGAKSVRGKGPVELLYFESVKDKITAAKRERELKGWTRQKKLNLTKWGLSEYLNKKGLP